MEDDYNADEIARLRGRVAALESVCTVLLSHMVGHSPEGRRALADGLRELFETRTSVGTGDLRRQGMIEMMSKLAHNLVRELDV